MNCLSLQFQICAIGSLNIFVFGELASFKTLFLIVLLPGVDQFLSSQPSRSIFSRVEKQGKLEGELLNRTPEL